MDEILMTNRTIVACATPPGRGAIALLRISGPDAIGIVQRLWRGKSLYAMESHTAHLGYLYSLGTSDTPLDQVLLTLYRHPHSYTGEDLIELGLHGSPIIVERVVSSLIDAGAVPAEPGEFSRRAVTNGKMSLLSAEAAADLVSATSRASQKAAMNQMRGGVHSRLKELKDSLLQMVSMLELELDFSEEDVEFASREELEKLAGDIAAHLKMLHASYKTGKMVKEGIPVAIVGPTNAGKSTLLNYLAGETRAIVSSIHGTTRDVIEDNVRLGDYLFRFQDTAGLRETDDEIESIGIELSFRALSNAAIVLFMVDCQGHYPTDHYEEVKRKCKGRMGVLFNKNDGKTDEELCSLNKYLGAESHFYISLQDMRGLQPVIDWMVDAVRDDELACGDVLITNQRHALHLAEALSGIDRVSKMLKAVGDAECYVTTDLIAQEVHHVIDEISEITGDSLNTPAVLSNIFSKFCIGK